ncbi:MAG: hypothetical protein O3C28_01590 [Proteobacteria bacterium]|nr:hypothetical protein [Pseudomonadota bacterium]
MSFEGAKQLLEAAWGNENYQASRSVIYEMGALEAFPNLNEMLALSHFVAKHRGNRGPQVIAFVSPEFESAVVKNMLAGFARIIGLKMCYCADISAARQWAADQL